jgi:hypothetical protein
MLSFDMAYEALNNSLDNLPQQIQQGLNGGIILLPDVKKHPEGVRGDLYILGQYHFEPHGFGRYITIYYGSFRMAYGHLPEEEQRKKLEDVLHHELIHHMEHLAGDKTLEYKDAEEIREYCRKIVAAGKNAP